MLSSWKLVGDFLVIAVESLVIIITIIRKKKYIYIHVYRYHDKILKTVPLRRELHTYGEAPQWRCKWLFDRL